jgi:hypothetical protein
MMTLDKKYHDDLVTALRFHEISGERVGEVLAEVEAHVTETGEDPNEAFGKPRDYAKQVAAQLDPATGKRSTGETVAISIASGTLAMFGTSFFGGGLALDQPTIDYSLRDVVAQPTLLVMIIIGTLLAFRAYTARSHNKLLGAGVAVAAVLALGSQILCNKFLDDVTPVLRLPSWLVLTLGVVFLVALAVLLTQAIRRNRVRYPAAR